MTASAVESQLSCSHPVPLYQPFTGPGGRLEPREIGSVAQFSTIVRGKTVRREDRPAMRGPDPLAACRFDRLVDLLRRCAQPPIGDAVEPRGREVDHHHLAPTAVAAFEKGPAVVAALAGAAHPGQAVAERKSKAAIAGRT